ncbi:MAG: hypothetical protein IPI59_06020 [Sphingobacteriales bacterium]|jgi:hypothetical protein|nr:hypothetical protein [Sphingobacteriales bacterium]MBP9141546.1 hypothetical protein [Chitinophagales bacterium]MDA0198381.1 hypothetical protein [Bacteroidota bacterium]MBK6891071.1 hypothetical protein [Sphingobacteriales bacterium]MBK7527102.1 hypothetical protein [Sphingobacteriales bacterium]
MNNSDQILIEKYINNQLTAAEKISFEQQLSVDTDLRDATFKAKLYWAMLQHPLGKSLLIDNVLNNNNTVETALLQQTYTLEEILDMFTPIDYLESEAITRGAAPKNQATLVNLVVAPPNSIDCTNMPLSFILHNALPYPLFIVVYDNLEEEVLRQTIPADRTNFEVAVNNLAPGRYYWRIQLDKSVNNETLRRQYGTATGSFTRFGHLYQS